MKNLNRKSIILVILLTILISVFGCSSEPSLYNAPKGAPYEGLYVVDKMNSSSSYSYSKGVDKYTVTMKWKTEDENIDYAELTDEYYLEWSYDELSAYELCEPLKDMSDLRNKKYTIKPGEELEIKFDIDTYFDELYEGYYNFVKILNVVNKDGTSSKMVVSFSLDLSNE